MFFLLPVAVDYRASRQPVVTYAWVGLCAFLFLVTLLVGMTGGVEAMEGWYGRMAFIPARGHLHTWVTSLFMHAGFFHLLGNLVYLYLFGACTEDILGRGWFVAFYLVGGLVATSTHILLTPDHFASEVPLVGASGAISACMGAFAVLLKSAKVEFRFLYFFVFFAGSKEFHLPSWLMMTLWFLDDLLGLFLSLAEVGGGGIAFAAHVGGFLFGAFVGAIMRARGWKPDGEDADTIAAAPSQGILRPRRVAPPLPTADSDP